MKWWFWSFFFFAAAPAWAQDVNLMATSPDATMSNSFRIPSTSRQPISDTSIFYDGDDQTCFVDGMGSNFTLSGYQQMNIRLPSGCPNVTTVILRGEFYGSSASTIKVFVDTCTGNRHYFVGAPTRTCLNATCFEKHSLLRANDNEGAFARFVVIVWKYIASTPPTRPLKVCEIYISSRLINQNAPTSAPTTQLLTSAPTVAPTKDVNVMATSAITDVFWTNRFRIPRESAQTIADPSIFYDGDDQTCFVDGMGESFTLSGDQQLTLFIRDCPKVATVILRGEFYGNASTITMLVDIDRCTAGNSIINFVGAPRTCLNATCFERHRILRSGNNEAFVKLISIVWKYNANTPPTRPLKLCEIYISSRLINQSDPTSAPTTEASTTVVSTTVDPTTVVPSAPTVAPTKDVDVMATSAITDVFWTNRFRIPRESAQTIADPSIFYDGDDQTCFVDGMGASYTLSGDQQLTLFIRDCPKVATVILRGEFYGNASTITMLVDIDRCTAGNSIINFVGAPRTCLNATCFERHRILRSGEKEAFVKLISIVWKYNANTPPTRPLKLCEIYISSRLINESDPTSAPTTEASTTVVSTTVDPTTVVPSAPTVAPTKDVNVMATSAITDVFWTNRFRIPRESAQTIADPSIFYDGDDQTCFVDGMGASYTLSGDQQLTLFIRDCPKVATVILRGEFYGNASTITMLVDIDRCTAGNSIINFVGAPRTCLNATCFERHRILRSGNNEAFVKLISIVWKYNANTPPTRPLKLCEIYISSRLINESDPTSAPTTEASTTVVSTTSDPTTVVPTTDELTTSAPTTDEVTTVVSTTADPTTVVPTTDELTTSAPTTDELTTSDPTTVVPTTDEVTTSAPTTDEVTTSAPTTDELTTSAPTTDEVTTSAPTTDEMTTSAPTTDELTTSAPTTDELTTSAPTTDEVTTSAPTTDEVTTSAPTTDELTTSAPTTDELTTSAPTTDELTTSAPTTDEVTTSAPTTDELTTSAPTTDEVTTSAPTTDEMTTSAPTTDELTTSAPTTDELTTSAPTTHEVTTSAPTTDELTTSAPTTDELTTSAPTTDELTTSAPTTDELTTSAPTTDEVTTSAPTTDEMTTSAPTTDEVTTSVPTTAELTTSAPTTDELTTSAPTTDEVTTSAPTTDEMTTSAPTTDELTTSAPTTDELTTSAPTTHEVTTSAPTTDELTTSAPTTDELTTSAPTTDEVTTSAPTTDEMTTSAPTTDELTTSAPTTDELTTSVPTTDEVTTSVPTTDEVTTSVPTTDELTTSVPTTDDVTTSAPTTDEVTTSAPTTDEVTTSAPTTDEVTTSVPTTDEVTTSVPTTDELTTSAPTTDELTTSAPTTDEVTTSAPTTDELTTSAPTTDELTTSAPTTDEVTTSVPTTDEVTTSSPTTDELTTSVPTTDEVTTSVPTTAELTTSAPTTDELTTSAPTTDELTTSAPTTDELTTSAPTTDEVTTSVPTTDEVTTSVPTTDELTTSAPTTDELTTSAPTTDEVTTSAPTTDELTTSAPTTDELTTSVPTTDEVTTSVPTTAELTTSAPTTDELTTSAPTTDELTTSAPTTDELTTSAPTTDEVTTSVPTTDEVTTSVPTTDEVTTSSPTPDELTTSVPTTDEVTTSVPTTDEVTTVVSTTALPTTSFRTTARVPAASTAHPTTVPSSSFSATNTVAGAANYSSSNASNTTGVNSTVASVGAVAAVAGGAAIKLSVGITVGIIFLLLLLLILLIFIVLKRKKRKKNKVHAEVENHNDENEDTQATTSPQLQSRPSTPEADNATQPVPHHDTSVKLAVFPDHVSNLHSLGGMGLASEFQSLQIVGKTKRMTVGNSSENSFKNRNGAVIPYDDNRVILQDLHGMTKTKTDYINASFIDGFQSPKRYIAYQDPTAGTCSDVWRMVWSESVAAIVMLSDSTCEEYWNDTGVQTYDGLSVKVVEIRYAANYTVRSMELYLEDNKRSIKHYHFKSWPDKETPELGLFLLGMLYDVRREVGSGRLAVHCSTGSGRTGTFLAILSMMDRVDAGDNIDVHGYAREMRTKRMEMVQTLDQYQFVYAAVLDYVRCCSTEISLGEFSEEAAKYRPNTVLMPFSLKRKYELLKSVSPKFDKSKCSAAFAPSLEVVRRRNKSLKSVPLDSNRVLLRPLRDPTYPSFGGADEADYINASYIDGYDKKKKFIVTQHPMEMTKFEFWRMSVQEGVATIINLTETKEEKPYWPDTEKVNETDSGYYVRGMKVKGKNKFQRVKQFHYYDWPDKDFPRNPKDVIAMMREVDTWQKENNCPPIVVHCRTGSGRSGAFCTAWNVVDQMENEKVVDILHAAKLVESQRPGILSSLESFQSIWLILVGYNLKLND